MRASTSGLFEVVWFVLGGLMLVMGIDVTTSSGFGDSWYYFVFGLLALAMYFMRRRMRLSNKK